MIYKIMKIWEKEIIIKDFISRKTSRKYKELLMWNNEIGVWGEVKMNIKNVEEANNFLVLNMTNLTQEEIDEMKDSDFDELFNKINKLKETPTVA